MARYVDAEKIIVEIENYFCNFLQSQKFDGYESADLTSQWHCDGLIKAIEIIMDAPTVDIREIIEADEYKHLICSHCLSEFDAKAKAENSTGKR